MHERSWMKSILPTALWRKLEKELDDEAYETPEKVPTRGSILLHFLLPPQPFCAELVSSLSAIPAGILGLSALAQHHTNALPSSTYMMLAFLFSYSVTSYDLYLQERKQRPQTTFTEVLCAPFNGGSSLLSEWRFHIFAHAVLMILQMLLTSVMLGRCGLTRTLIIMECGHTAVAILAFASKYYVQAAIDSTYNTVPPSPRIHSRGSNTIGTNNDSNSNRVHGHRRTGSGLLDNLDSGDGSDSKGRPEDALMLSVALVGGGIAMLLYCDLHSTTSAVLLAATTLVYYIRAFYLLPLPQQIQTLPLGVASALTAPLGLRSLFTKGLTALFSPTNYLFLTTSAFSRFSEFRSAYVCKRRKRKDGLLYVTTELFVILAGVVTELIFAVEPKCTFFTVASACIILSGIHAAMVHLPHRVSCPKVTEDDYRKLAIFAKKKVLPGDGSSGSGGVGGSFLGGTEKFTHTQRLRGNTGTGAVQTLSRGVRSLLDIPRTRKLFLYFILNLAFMAVEVGYGFFSNSLGLISDGFHMLFDCFGLFVGLCAAFVSRWEGNSVFTYGYGRVQTLSCLVNCVSLVVISATIFLESLHRFFHKAEMHGSRLLSLSIAGLLVNLVGVFSFHGGCDSDNSDFHQHLTTTSWQCTTKKQKRCYAAASGNNTLHHHHHHNHHQLHGGSDENMRSVFLHILADTLSSIGLIISSYFVQHRGWTIADPVCSLLISTLIFTSVLPLLRLSWCVLLQGTTLSDARIAALEERLSEAAVTAWEADGTREISSGNNTNKRTVTGLCVWDKFPGSTAATVVLHVPEAANEQRVLTAALKVMSDFGISSSCVECVKDN